MPHIFVAGYPSSLGGANTELWHTLKLWRSGGIDVTCLALKDPPEQEWVDRVEGIGCKTVERIGVDKLDQISVIRDHKPRSVKGATVVAFCNWWFLQAIRRFDRLGCRIVWVPCMTWPFPDERLWTRVCGMMNAYVFQSTYQAAQMMPQIEIDCKNGDHDFQTDRFHQIRGAFDTAEFPFRPKPIVEGEPFVIGRLSRSLGRPSNEPALEKYPADLWSQYGAIRRRIPHLKARVMGWNEGIEQKCGKPPEWAECLPDCAETSQEFLQSLHCLVPGIGCCKENWPRVGLEAMSSGVPIVVEAKGGWPEMHARTAGDREAQVTEVCRLSEPECHYHAAGIARARVESLSNPETILAQWQSLFEGLR